MDVWIKNSSSSVFKFFISLTSGKNLLPKYLWLLCVLKRMPLLIVWGYFGLMLTVLLFCDFLLFWSDVDGSTLCNLLTKFFYPWLIFFWKTLPDCKKWWSVGLFFTFLCESLLVFESGCRWTFYRHSRAGGAGVIANLLPFWTNIDKCNEL